MHQVIQRLSYVFTQKLKRKHKQTKNSSLSFYQINNTKFMLFKKQQHSQHNVYKLTCYMVKLNGSH